MKTRERELIEQFPVSIQKSKEVYKRAARFAKRQNTFDDVLIKVIIYSFGCALVLFIAGCIIPSISEWIRS